MKFHKYALVVLVVLCIGLFVLGCGSSGSSGGSGGGGGSGTNYFPSTNGYSWSYLYDDGSSSVTTVEGTYQVSPSITAQVFKYAYVSAAGSVGTGETFYVVNSSGVYYYGSSSASGVWVTTEACPMLEFPLSIGNYWTFMEGSGYSIICSVEAQETVCVTAGTFADCYRVAMVFVGGEVYSTTYIWLANNVGMVKEVSGSTTEELVSKNF